MKLIACQPSGLKRARRVSPMTVEAFLHQARGRLAPFSETASLDAQVLLAHVLEHTRTWLLAHTDEPITEMQAEAAEQLLRRREAGEPLPYLLGHWEFYGLDFTVTRDVLIPRPETELLVEQALAWLEANPERRQAADVGTGSGCIAVSLATLVPDLQVLATDISEAALEVARVNATRHEASGRITFLTADLLPTDAGPFDLICANLPYIPSETLHGLDVYRHEPVLALDGGVEGLEPIGRMIRIAPQYIKPGGALMVEIEAGQGEKVAELARTVFPEGEVEVMKDLAGRDRLVVIKI